MPPDAFTSMPAPRTTSAMSATSLTVAPPVEKPVDVCALRRTIEELLPLGGEPLAGIAG